MIFEVIDYFATDEDCNPIPHQTWLDKLEEEAERSVTAAGFEYDIERDLVWYVEKLNTPFQCRVVQFQSRATYDDDYGKEQHESESLLFIFVWDCEEDKTMFLLKYA
jgi:hypothetical protein